MVQHRERFTSRVENYIKSRPGYPKSLLEHLKETCGLQPSWPVVDIGSGTGILSELFLRNGNPVVGVEPNAEMRDASEKLLARYPAFRAVDGSAEDTMLPRQSARLITAGQAFHWFNQERAQDEFRRILQPGGFVGIVFNTRKIEGNAFGLAYEDVVGRYSSGSGYAELRHENLTREVFDTFYGPRGCAHLDFPNEQHFDLAGVRARLASMSWVPLEGDPRYDQMMTDIEEIFNKYHVDQGVTVEYVTELHWGRLA